MTLRFPGDRGIPVSTNKYPLKSSQQNGQGLTININRNNGINFWEICGQDSFMVHSPYEYPGNFDAIDMILFDFGYDFEVLIIPEIIRTDADLKSYEPKKRGCFFEGEKKLKYFKVYTRRNCESECLADKLQFIPLINCTPFYMVRSDSMNYCDYRNEYRLTGIIYTIQNRKRLNCFCLDECDSIKYRLEIQATKRYKYNNTLGSFRGYTESLFEFKFKDVNVVPLRRYQSFTFSEFLAQSGGMMGLFAGISALSIIELVYFWSLRWMVNVWRWIRKRCCKS
jgi:acid-sensing ion channel, other